MEVYKDIQGKELNEGDKIVFESDGTLGLGVYSHPAGTTVVIKELDLKYNIRFIQKHQTNMKIYKI